MNFANLPERMRTALEDLTGEMVYARRNADLGRLALLCYCEVKHWARLAGEERLAQLSGALVAEQPASDRTEFLGRVDAVIAELEDVCERAGIHEGSKSLEIVRVQ
ncbi:hypothetical protein QTI66_03830 [Variovorax sp. J22R133]|uniref:hypothetical protein n=1 Tax=Variovorax brevis TaxID=3053503 RepID=UPI0025778771|nr:hypothetical protein [Variovorax sp. J22R133]MDM0111262.1 hypothetical protein [Variovorax sp. J22R133]